MPFTERESLAYIEHRLDKAGGSSAAVFTRGALRTIVRARQGHPAHAQHPVRQRAGDRPRLPEEAGDRAHRPRGDRATSRAGRGLRRVRWVWAVAGGGAGRRSALFLASPYRELLIASADAPVQLPALPLAPARAVPAVWGADLMPEPGEGAVATAVIVQKGDTFLELTESVYGSSRGGVLRIVLEANPDIKDPERLSVGTPIRFPAIRSQRAGTTSAR